MATSPSVDATAVPFSHVSGSGRTASNDVVVGFPVHREVWGGELTALIGLSGCQQLTIWPVARVSLPWMSWNYPEVLELIQPSATPFRVDEGERQVLGLRQSPIASRARGSVLKNVSCYLLRASFCNFNYQITRLPDYQIHFSSLIDPDPVATSTRRPPPRTRPCM
jgi:hypothetical protein